MSITYDQIKKANETLQLTPVKGKDYAMVNQRVKAFRMVYPDGFITTKLETNEEGLCVFRAEVGFYQNMIRIVIGTGTAFEERTSSPINRTSYIENCETSAVGRALGMAGFGIDTSICSADEMKGVAEIEKEQMRGDGYEPDAKVKDTVAKFIERVMPEARLKKMLAHYGVNAVAELTANQAGEVLNILKVEGPEGE